MPQAGTSQPIWTVTPEKRDEAVRRIIDKAHPRKIILFGSQARGEANNDSDLDLMVIVDDPGGEWQRTIELRRALLGLLIPVDIVVTTLEKFEYWSDTPGNVYYEAKREGRVMYDSHA